jgi:hypothetical protein
MALVGNTVRLTAKFYDFNNALADPAGIVATLKFYDSKKNQIGVTVNLTVANKVSTGIMRYDYTIPNTTSPFIIYEFSGTVDGVPSLDRGSIPVRWV